MTGQIIKRSEKTWLVRIFLGRDGNGKRKYFNKTIHGSKKDAQKFLTEKNREMDLGISIQPAAMTLNEFLDKWLSESVKQKTREQTANNYAWLMKKYVRPTLGAKRLSNITTLDAQKLWNQMTAKGLTPRTVRYTNTILKYAFKQAIQWNFLSKNPCEFCVLPRNIKREMQCLSPQQAVKFLETAKESKHFCLFLLAIETGLRPSEFLALRWQDINFEKAILSVQRAMLELPKGKFRSDEPKTLKSRRTIPLSNTLIDELKRHRRKQLEQKMKLGSDYQIFDLIFANETGSPFTKQHVRLLHFQPLLAKAGLPKIRLHDLRHLCASLLLADGVSPKVIQERLGHSSISITLDIYSHILPSMQSDATSKLERMLKTG